MSELVPAVGVAIFSSAGKLLLARHAYDGCWALVGGKVERGETTEEAALREVAEEVSIRLGEITLIGEFWDSPIYTVDYPVYGPTSYRVTLYGSELTAGQTPACDGDEILEARWWAPDEITSCRLAADMAEMLPAALTWYADSGGTRRSAQAGTNRRG